RNVTRYATSNTDVSWSRAGGKVAFISQRRGAPLMYVLPLQRAAVGSTSAPGSSAPADIDWEDIHLRASPAAPVPPVEGTIAPDGGKVAFRSGADLWMAAAGGGELSRIAGDLLPNVSEHGFGPQIRWSKRPGTLVYFLDNQGVIRLGRPGGSSYGL